MPLQEFNLGDNSFLYIGKMGAGYVYDVAGSLLLILVDDLALRYEIRNYVTGEALFVGRYNYDEIEEPPDEYLRNLTAEDFEGLFT